MCRCLACNCVNVALVICAIDLCCFLLHGVFSPWLACCTDIHQHWTGCGGGGHHCWCIKLLSVPYWICVAVVILSTVDTSFYLYVYLLIWDEKYGELDTLHYSGCLLCSWVHVGNHCVALTQEYPGCNFRKLLLLARYLIGNNWAKVLQWLLCNWQLSRVFET